MSEMDNEIWMDVVGYEKLFSISSKGRLFSKRTSKILKQNVVGNSYNACVTKIGGRSGKNLVLKIHREVAKAFIPNPNNLPMVNHKDGDKSNNDVENLEWVTAKENINHAINNGLSTFSHLLESSILRRKLSDDDVRFIKNNFKPYDKEFGVRALCRKFNVSHSTISSIIKNIRYKDVD